MRPHWGPRSATDTVPHAPGPGHIFCSAFIDYIKGRFEAIKDIYSPYQIKLQAVFGDFLFFFVPPFIGYTKGRFEAIKDIYSPYQIHLHQVRFPQLIASYKFFLTGPCLVLVAMIWL